MPIIPVVAAGIGAVGAVAASRSNAKAADRAAAASQSATDQTIALQREQDARAWEATRGTRELGNAATARLQGLINGTVNPLDFVRSTPGYQVNLDAGQRQLNASAAARGGLLSGAAAREGLRYGADYATGVLNNERNALYQAAGLGTSGVNIGVNAGQSSANATQNALSRNADNLASSFQARANATTSGISGLTGAALYGLNNTNWSKAGNALGRWF